MAGAAKSKPPTDKAVRRARLRKLRKALDARGCDAVLITNSVDIRWLAPFHGDDSWAYVDRKHFVIISDFRFEEDLASVAGIADVHIRKGSIVDAAANLITGARPRALAVQAERLSIATRDALAKRVGARRLRPQPSVFEPLRAIKDELEIAAIRKALALQQRAFNTVVRGLKPGMREIEIAATLEHAMRSLGAQGASFPTIIAAGANGSRPHHEPTRKTLRAGRPLLIDWGARASEYCGDLTRTITFGAWPRPLGDVYKIVLEAQRAGIEAIKPGVPCCEVDRAARSVIERAGYGERFGHSLGHGVGLDVHESPRLASTSDTPLHKGMVVTIEPGVYLPGVGGVRIEDVALVGASGPTLLSSLPRSLKWATK